MKAVPFYDHGSTFVLKYVEDFPDPISADNDVIIDVKYCGLNHLDIWTRQGITGKKFRLPHICGCDIVGTVASLPRGKKSQLVKKGDRVMVYPGVSCGVCNYCKKGRETLCSKFTIVGGPGDYNGGYAEKVAIPSSNVIKIPDSIKDEVAATLAVSYLAAWNMLKSTGAGKGKTVLVYGAAGGLGMAVVQLAKALGSTVITTASNGSKIAFAKKIGAHHVIDRKSQEIASEVMKITEGRGADIVVDHVGAATWATSIASLKQGGRMAVCGMTSGNDAVVPVRAFYSKQITMTGALLGTKSELLELLGFVGRKKITPSIDSSFPLKEASAAQQKIESGAFSGKIILKI